MERKKTSIRSNDCLNVRSQTSAWIVADTTCRVEADEVSIFLSGVCEVGRIHLWDWH